MTSDEVSSVRAIDLEAVIGPDIFHDLSIYVFPEGEVAVQVAADSKWEHVHKVAQRFGAGEPAYWVANLEPAWKPEQYDIVRVFLFSADDRVTVQWIARHDYVKDIPEIAKLL